MQKVIDVPLLFSLWSTSIQNRELAARLGIANSRLWEIRRRYGLPYRSQERQKPTADPSPEEIETRSAVVRRRWTQAETARRLVGATPGWHPPECRVIL
jgi:hypothetical protein